MTRKLPSTSLAPRRPRRGAMVLAVCIGLGAPAATAIAQSETAPPPEPSAGTGWEAGTGQTTITRTAPENSQTGKLRLVALLTADGQRIDKGLVWRVFQSADAAGGKSQLVGEHREASPTLELEPGDYLVSAAFGRAHLTKKVSVKPADTPAVEQFVINAGGLRLSALVGSSEAPPNSIAYDILSDRDQTDNRKVIMSGAKPGLVIRLNSGIYHIISTYGDANAIVESDITVEAGKLTEAQVKHSAAKTTFKLVQRPGGEALSDTQWSIQTNEGRVVKESVGALPTHLLAPGAYRAIAKRQGKTYSDEFTLEDGQSSVIEVIAASAP